MLIAHCTCGEVFRANDEQSGFYVRCRRCGKTIPLGDAPRTEVTAPVDRSGARNSATSRYGPIHRGKKTQWPLIGLAVLVLAGLGAVLNNSKTATTRKPAGSADSSKENPFAELESLAGVTDPDTMRPATLNENAPSPEFDSLWKLAYPKLLTKRPDAAGLAECVGDPQSPANSQELILGRRGGYGTLKIDNGSSSDAVVALFDVGLDRVVRRAYIRANQIGKLIAIPPGNYYARFAFGSAYSSNKRIFCSLHAASEFDRPLDFVEFEDDDSYHYSANSITLHKTITGNARTHKIDPKSVFSDGGGIPVPM